MNKNLSQCLPLSHLIYSDNEIDKDLADKLIVYHYPLQKSYKWHENNQLKNHIDESIDSRAYAYLMKSYDRKFGLYVAVESESDLLPNIVNSEGQTIQPERVYYHSELNAVWIRLIFRSLDVFKTQVQGTYLLGQPLIPIDSWSKGIQGLSVDCRTQQLKDRQHTEVVLFHENRSLRIVDTEQQVTKASKPLWVQTKDKVLRRWYPNKEKKPDGILYKEINKIKNSRQQRPFLDLRSAENFSNSWPMILKPIQEDFIRLASKYGFKLKPKVLEMTPIDIKTKAKSTRSKSKFTSINLSGEFHVLDLRVNTQVTTKQVLDVLDGLLQSKGLEVHWSVINLPNLDSVASLVFEKWQRVLVLLDQRKGVESDRYIAMQSLLRQCAIQHLNINPYDILVDPVEVGLLIESADEKDPVQLYIEPERRYYRYEATQFETANYKKMLALKLEVALKELELKALLINDERRVSSTLAPQQGLSESCLVITLGYLFTVQNDRPVLIPFDPTEPELRRLADSYLARFQSSVNQLLQLLLEQWPYSYRPEEVLSYYSTSLAKQQALAKRLTFILSHSPTGEISIMLQDPKYDRPHILPLGMEAVQQHLTKKSTTYLLQEWLLPEVSLLRDIASQLEQDGELKAVTVRRFCEALPDLVGLWQEEVLRLYQSNQSHASYDELKKAMMRNWLQRQNKQKDTAIVSCWDSVLGYYFDRPLTDVKRWIKQIPGVRRIWFDVKQGYCVVGGLEDPQYQLMRQPSIRQWHALQGDLNIDLLRDLLDVDWVRVNQLAGNPCVASLIRRWQEINLQQPQILN